MWTGIAIAMYGVGMPIVPAETEGFAVLYQGALLEISRPLTDSLGSTANDHHTPMLIRCQQQEYIRSSCTSWENSDHQRRGAMLMLTGSWINSVFVPQDAFTSMIAAFMRRLFPSGDSD